ncbi:sigma factor [Nocardia harenae]|uniref:sigma factor n=1 Tax=Nocardia harenae TaxID=358707 RepID=UPI0008372A85|nr:sigma factor [Nocardia harenae]
MDGGTSALHRAVDAAARGDGDALGALLEQVRPFVTRYCRARLGTGPADAVATGICADLLTALPRFRESGGSFLAFAYRIASRTVADVLRRRGASSPEPLGELPESQREVLVLRLVLGLSADETARALHTTIGVVRVTQHRALDTLRTTLAA